MNNLMDEYIEFTKKNLRKYMKIIFEKYYDRDIYDNKEKLMTEIPEIIKIENKSHIAILDTSW